MNNQGNTQANAQANTQAKETSLPEFEFGIYTLGISSPTAIPGSGSARASACMK